MVNQALLLAGGAIGQSSAPIDWRSYWSIKRSYWLAKPLVNLALLLAGRAIGQSSASIGWRSYWSIKHSYWLAELLVNQALLLAGGAIGQSSAPIGWRSYWSIKRSYWLTKPLVNLALLFTSYPRVSAFLQLCSKLSPLNNEHGAKQVFFRHLWVLSKKPDIIVYYTVYNKGNVILVPLILICRCTE